jgi:branched-chain amino acid transport system ATP-binding protein
MLELENVHAYYGDSHVLQGISLVVNEGEVVCLLGRNGAGKTTTILTTMGYLKPRPGRIIYGGQEIGALPPHQISRLGIGFVPQERGIFPSLTVVENLTVFARGMGKRRWTLPRVFELFPGLRARAENLGFQLSGGEQQMLSIGRALMTHPALIILDEATEGLAPQVVAEIWRVIGTIRAGGIAALIVDRDYRRVLAQSDRAVVLQKGQVVLAGSSSEVSASALLSSYLGI